MKKLLLAFVLSCISGSAFATCGSIPLTVKDASNATQNISSATAADGNCKTYIDADTSSQIHNDLTAAIPAGTNLIGKVGIDQTTPGTTNGVQVNAALPAGTNLIGKTGIDQTTPGTTNGVQDAATGATASGVPSKASYNGVSVGGNLTGLVGDPCQVNAHTYKPLSITTATTTNIITGTSAKKIYICQLFLTSAAADNVAIIEGTTGATCGSGTAGVIGGTTAANGLNFAANGGVSLGNGLAAIAQTATNNNDICLITSAATPLAGGITYVVQ